MREILILFLIYTISFFHGCTPSQEIVSETQDGYSIQKEVTLNVILETSLNSNINKRGDTFSTRLKDPFSFRNKILLPKNTKIRGLVKRVEKYEKLGDRAGLILLFDQIVMPDGRKIPIEASLDTEKGSEVIKIKGKRVRNVGILGGAALVGAMGGKKTLGKDGEKKGLIVGAAVGTGAVVLSDMMEVLLPEETELLIKLDEPLFIPKL